VTADAPGSSCGRHCASCAYPAGLTPQRISAHWRTEHRGTVLVHTHHAVTS
jgi:hypothetical protein